MGSLHDSGSCIIISPGWVFVSLTRRTQVDFGPFGFVCLGLGVMCVGFGSVGQLKGRGEV